MLSRFKDMPPNPEFPLSEDAMEKVMHVALQIDENTMLMGADSFSTPEHQLVSGNNFSFAVDVKSTEQADQLFARLSEGGEVTMPMSQMFWGSYFGTCKDKFGINWMVSHEPQQSSP
ncbi:MAG: VOC family protein [Gammaproteobacteria bacterium]|nr:VOC family protein [Gammaproteobacteria bacterium]